MRRLALSVFVTAQTAAAQHLQFAARASPVADVVRANRYHRSSLFTEWGRMCAV
jgi:hypothetical protein